ncbi:hypothetical protein EKO27_g7861 [Xylaria grammica]|uniref:Uncharacterized protein n=1 Tax=Xylaria grammica TaxID=363999 RepID=A0A439CYM5_9PEZI|nr:hypothetical protein EKO27_g7861 [Xylaria grammica]
MEGWPRFPMKQAHKLAFCVIYFERAIEYYMPGMTQTTDSMRPGGWKNSRCWEAIRATKDMGELYYLMCYMRHGVEMPPSRSAQEAIDWIMFTTAFVTAACRVDAAKLDAAAAGKAFFTEALGLPVTNSPEVQAEAESLWVTYGHLNSLRPKHLQAFMDCPARFWYRMSAMKESFEKELAELPANGLFKVVEDTLL